ncbi:MAG: hypothetical protein Q4B70_16135 [Lachnospiraceae bacterium]|nr:hypothetical protein [Lachnospiraceae bacterium]
MIDIHTHIIPEVDDGSDSLDDSLMMAELAVESGVHTLVATPHCNMIGTFENYYSPEWQNNFNNLERYLKENQIALRLVRGMEIFATDDVADKIEDELLLPLGDTRYYLIEFPFGADPFWMGDILDSVLNLDKIPVIAHPERYYCIQDEPMILYEWMQQGCLSQLNKGSVFGRFGRHAQKAAEILLDNRLVTCMASDAHTPYQRTTFMGDIRDYLKEEFGEKYANLLLLVNPQRILEDRLISNDELERPEDSRRFWFT